MKDSGEHFYHNIQGIRVVEYLESGYDWDRRIKEMGYGRGMNLTHAVREGILKHTNRGLKGEERVSDWKKFDLDFDKPCHLEGEVVALSDEISQRIHDLEDGLRSMLLSMIDDGKSVEEISDGKRSRRPSVYRIQAYISRLRMARRYLRDTRRSGQTGGIGTLLQPGIQI